MQTVHFNPSEIARIFDVDVATVRRWIYRGLLASERTPGGHHRVSQEQLASFAEKNGLRPVDSYTVQRLSRKGPEAAAEEYYESITDGSGSEVLARLMLAGTSFSKVLDLCVAPTMRRIGDEWKSGRLPIHAEHTMSFRVARDIAKYAELVPDKQNAGTLILACVPGETHVLPLEMAETSAREAGWKRVFLGVNVDSSELEKSVREHKPDLLVISKTYGENDARAFLKRAQATGVKVIAGGQGWTPVERSLMEEANIPYVASFSDLESRLRNAPMARDSVRAKRGK